MKKLLLFLAFSLPAYGQGTYTAASASYTDVNAVINGPTHTAVNGDTIQIPCSGTQSVTWGSTLNINANITLTALGGTPNVGASTFGSGANCLTITGTASTMFQFSPTYASANNTATLQNMTLIPGSGAYTPVRANGTCTSSGCPNFRVDNVIFGGGTTANSWQYGQNTNTGEFTVIVDNVFGVADHNTLTTGSHCAFISTNLSSYLGVGSWGDNSWAQPDSMGAANNFFIENNQLYQEFWSVLENEQTYPNIGGGRTVIRFNHVSAHGFFFLVGGHGLDTDGRPRSMRHNEVYGNTTQCVSGGECFTLTSVRGGTAITFGNTQTVDGSGAKWDQVVSMNAYRYMGDGFANVGVGSCGGATSGNAAGPFDGNTGTTFYSGTVASGSGTSFTVSGSPGWSSNQWANFYSVWDVTQGWVSVVTSNGSNTLNVSQAPHGYINGGTAINVAAGNSIQIMRANWCTDGAARGAGALLQGDPAVLASSGVPGPSNEASDPVLEWNDSFPSLSYGTQMDTSYYRSLQNNVDYFSDYSLGSPHAQTSPTSPFSGTTSTGVGFGTLANRPTCGGGCTTGVRYFATDQGTWNTSGNSFGQGTLYAWNGSAWATNYGGNSVGQPYTYPHPLAGGTPQVATPIFSPTTGTPPQTVTTTDATSGAALCGRNDGGTPTATTPGTCDGSPTYTITGSQSVTVNPTTLTAIGTKAGYANSSVASSTYSGSGPVCGDPSQTGPNYSGAGPGPGGAYYIPPSLVVGFTVPDTCTAHATFDGSAPTCSSAVYSGTTTISTATTETIRQIDCQAGYTSSNIIGGTWQTLASALTLSVGSTGTGSGTITNTSNCPTGTSSPVSGSVVTCNSRGNGRRHS